MEHFKRDRKKTNSVTELVKIIAREIFEEETDSLERRIKNSIGFARHLSELAETFQNKVYADVERAGRPWSAPEDNMLIGEMNAAIKTMANNHKRSEGAIRSRIKFLKENKDGR